MVPPKSEGEHQEAEDMSTWGIWGMIVFDAGSKSRGVEEGMSVFALGGRLLFVCALGEDVLRWAVHRCREQVEVLSWAGHR